MAWIGLSKAISSVGMAELDPAMKRVSLDALGRAADGWVKARRDDIACAWSTRNGCGTRL